MANISPVSLAGMIIGHKINMIGLIEILIYWSFISGVVSVDSESQPCMDTKSKEVRNGEKYTPRGEDPCKICVCTDGKPDLCYISSCSPQSECKGNVKEEAGSSPCCPYICNQTTSVNTNGTDATNLGLRLVASTVTSFLILALLLFMIHRLRQRRLLVMIRRLNGRRADIEGACISHHFTLDNDAAVGYFVGRDHINFGLYDEPPPPYTFWKPPESYIPPGEAPPPYEVSVGPGGNLILNNSLLGSGCDQTSQNTQTTPPASGEGSTSIITSGSELLSAQSDETTGREIDSVSVQCGSTSTASMCSDTDDGQAGETSSRPACAIRSDAYYENSSMCMPNNVTVLQIGDTTLRADDVVNGNTAFSCLDSVIDGSISAPSDGTCTCTNTIGRKALNRRCGNRCNSYGEFSESRQRRLVQDAEKRLSLQVQGQNNNHYPDPTSWNGEGSESSSSSSPTYEHQMLSMSSSDSSSADIDFGIPSTNVGAEVANSNLDASNSQAAESKESSAGKGKTSSLDRTLQQLRKLSLSRTSGKKKLVQMTNDKSCSVSTDKLSATPSTDVSANKGHLHEAVNPLIPHSGSKQRHHRRNVSMPSQDTAMNRPASLNLPLVCVSGEGIREKVNNIGSGCSVPVVIAVKCKALKPAYQLGGSSVQPGISDVLAVHKSNSSTSRLPSEEHCLSRSGSICSETGERRFPTRERDSSASRSRHKNTHSLGRHKKSQKTVTNQPVVFPGNQSSRCFSGDELTTSFRNPIEGPSDPCVPFKQKPNKDPSHSYVKKHSRRKSSGVELLVSKRQGHTSASGECSRPNVSVKPYVPVSHIALHKPGEGARSGGGMLLAEMPSSSSVSGVHTIPRRRVAEQVAQLEADGFNPGHAAPPSGKHYQKKEQFRSGEQESERSSNSRVIKNPHVNIL